MLKINHLLNKYPLDQDPQSSLEAKKYQQPIPSRQYILQVLTAESHPLTLDDLIAAFGLEHLEQIQAFEFRIRAMLRDSQVEKTENDTFIPLINDQLIYGRVKGHADGTGYVIPHGDGPDVFLSPFEMQRVLHGDEVAVVVKGQNRRRLEGKVVQVISHGNEQIVGRIHEEQGLFWLTPENQRISQDIYIAATDLNDAKIGQIVLAEIIRQPSKRSGPVGRVVKIVGEYMGSGTEIDAALHTYDIPHEWPAEVLAELDQIPDHVVQADLTEDRKDLRRLPLVTIDGETARDFDDAVYANRRKTDWRLVVAIADVSHYVRPGTALDAEAQKRGNSVYFPRRVIPMLPEKLSNGLCSLNPHVDRLCMVADMSISFDGQLKKVQVYPAVMHSQARLTYTEVYAFMTGQQPEDWLADRPKVIESIKEMQDLYAVLAKARAERGALEFETVETLFNFNDLGKIDSITPYARNDAHRLIEEMMLMANESVAKTLAQKQIPTLYRNHQRPSLEKLNDLRSFLKDFGLFLGGDDNPQPPDFLALQRHTSVHPQRHLLETVLLRSMSQAVYAPENLGHFGLAYEYYLHFTSPIRRYPDLLVHRGIRHLLQQGSGEHFYLSQQQLENLGEAFSATERRADEATRDVSAFLKCEYLSHHLGEIYPGTITSVIHFGCFIELDDFYVEGLVHVAELGDDYFVYDSVRHRLKGERTNISLQLGDKVKVLVDRVDVDQRKIDFKLIEPVIPQSKGVKHKAPRGKFEPTQEAQVEPLDSQETHKKPRKKKKYYKKKS